MLSLLLAQSILAAEPAEPVELFYRDEIRTGSLQAGGSSRFEVSVDRRTRLVAQTFVGDDASTCPREEAANDTTLTLYEHHQAGAHEYDTSVAGDDDGGPGHCSYVDHVVEPGSYSLVVEGESGALPTYGLRLRYGSPLEGPSYQAWMSTQPDGEGGGPAFHDDGSPGNPDQAEYDRSGVTTYQDVRCAALRRPDSGQAGWADDACELYLPFACRNKHAPHDWKVSSADQDGPWDEGHTRCQDAFGDDYPFAYPADAAEQEEAIAAAAAAEVPAAWINLSTDLGEPTDEAEWATWTFSPPHWKNLVRNPDAEAGDLSGWTITEAHGSGWQADLAEGQWSFHTSTDGWSRRQQEIDLRDEDFDAAYLDSAPPIYVSESFGKRGCPGQYELTVELLDADGYTIATKTTETVEVPGSCDSPDSYDTVYLLFENYDPGVRSIRISDGGTGVAIDDAVVALAAPNLLQAPAEDASWSVTGGSGYFYDPLQTHVIDGRWRNMPRGWYTDSGSPSRTQTVDLIAQGFEPHYLDGSPPLLASELFTSEASGDHHHLQVELLDQHHAVLDRWDSSDDAIEGGGSTVQESHIFRDYGQGVRFVRWTDSGSAQDVYGVGTALKAPYLGFLHEDRLRERRCPWCFLVAIGVAVFEAWYLSEDDHPKPVPTATVQPRPAPTWHAYVMRHGATDDGANLTVEGREAIEQAWASEPCPPSGRADIFFLATTDRRTSFGNERYEQSADAVEKSLRDQCFGIDIDRIQMPVGMLNAATPAELSDIMNEMNSPGPHEDPSTRIFILGSSLLKAMTPGDCSRSPCYLAGWAPFHELYDASHDLYDCTHTLANPNSASRQFMYNYLYKVDLQRSTPGANNLCASAAEIHLDSETQACSAHAAYLDHYHAAQTCQW